MANNAGAKKRIRQNATRRLRNRYRLSTTRTFIKKVRSATKKDEAEALLPKTYSMVDKCVKSNLFHKNRAARLKSSLAKHVAKLEA